MRDLTPEGQQAVNEIAGRYNLSSQAVTQMLGAVAAGGGSMAQFNIPELGGGGQWMQGGMTMVGDMFNQGLQATVDNLCNELSNLYLSQPYLPPRPAQSQSQNGGQSIGQGQQQSQGGSFNTGQQQQHGGGQQQGGGGQQQGGVSLFIRGTGGEDWWPEALGNPSSTGSQNNMRYAYFPRVNRLAVDAGGSIVIYDTLNHQIGGFSQQQSIDGSITLTSQFGTVPLGSLPRVSFNNPLTQPDQLADQMANKKPNKKQSLPQSETNQSTDTNDEPASKNVEPQSTEDILSAIKKLGDLNADGFLTDEEFAKKKTELLSRL